MAVDQPEALWLAPCEFMIGLADLVMKFERLFVDACLALVGVTPIARACAGEPGLRVDVDAQGQVGNQTVTSDPVDLEDRVPTQATGRSLVCDGRVRKAIRHHDLAFRKRR